ncbi:MAG: hypothetical protein AAF614_04305 [Chloroflexota bacterium]
MSLKYTPLLQLQRDLYKIPRGYERFKQYIAEMVDPETKDMKIPLPAMNPMGKDHIPALLDRYLAFDADEVADEAVTRAASGLGSTLAGFQAALVIADDSMGMWTNRYSVEFGNRFSTKPFFRRSWLVGLLWTSEEPSIENVREEILTAVYRGAHIQQHGFAQTLGDMLAQEGCAMAAAGCKSPELEPDELAYTEAVLEPYLGSEHYGEWITAVFGDPAAHELGYEPMGLSPRAGLALALHNAKQ